MNSVILIKDSIMMLTDLLLLGDAKLKKLKSRKFPTAMVMGRLQNNPGD